MKLLYKGEKNVKKKIPFIEFFLDKREESIYMSRKLFVTSY